MHVWTHDRYRFPLPEAHKFPITKYGLLRERLLADGLVTQDTVHEAPAVPWEALERVHERALLERIRTGALGLRESLGLRLPWSPELVERGRRSVSGRLLAAREARRVGVAMTLGGDPRHAGRAFVRGYCLFNDVALAV